MSTLKQKLAFLAITALPIFLWAKLLFHYLAFKKQISLKKIAHSKHNCVVTFSRDGGMFGWPEYPNGLPKMLKNYNKFLEPILYFISTAEHRLDISVMILSCTAVINALTQAVSRGVKIRLILDANYADTKNQMQTMRKKGVKIMYDQKFLNTETLMHNKYAVKDFDRSNGSGFTLCGSMNWTQTAITENYEFIVFSTNLQIVGAFNKNFEETWEFLQKVKETNLLSETIYQL